MKNLKRYKGFLCEILFSTMYHRVSKDLIVKGFILEYLSEEKQKRWFFCITDKKENIQFYLDKTISKKDLGEIESRGIKTLLICLKDLIPMGHQSKNSPNFGKFMHVDRIKFWESMEIWLSS